MTNILKASAAALALLSASTLALAPAKADVICQNATGTSSSLSQVLSSTKWVGAVFTLDQATSITGVGALYLTNASVGANIFAALVAVPTGASNPGFDVSTAANASAGITSAALAHVSIDARSILTGPNKTTAGGALAAFGESDFAAPVTLQAGTYAVIFGTGAFGATGYADIGLNETIPTGQTDTAFSTFNGAWSTTAGRAEVAVYGKPVAPVPEPASWALMIGGLGLAGATLRRRALVPAAA